MTVALGDSTPETVETWRPQLISRPSASLCARRRTSGRIKQATERVLSGEIDMQALRAGVR